MRILSVLVILVVGLFYWNSGLAGNLTYSQEVKRVLAKMGWYKAQLDSLEKEKTQWPDAHADIENLSLDFQSKLNLLENDYRRLQEKPRKLLITINKASVQLAKEQKLITEVSNEFSNRILSSELGHLDSWVRNSETQVGLFKDLLSTTKPNQTQEMDRLVHMMEEYNSKLSKAKNDFRRDGVEAPSKSWDYENGLIHAVQLFEPYYRKLTSILAVKVKEGKLEQNEFDQIKNRYQREIHSLAKAYSRLPRMTFEDGKIRILSLEREYEFLERELANVAWGPSTAAERRVTDQMREIQRQAFAIHVRSTQPTFKGEEVPADAKRSQMIMIPVSAVVGGLLVYSGPGDLTAAILVPVLVGSPTWWNWLKTGGRALKNRMSLMAKNGATKELFGTSNPQRICNQILENKPWFRTYSWWKRFKASII